MVRAQNNNNSVKDSGAVQKASVVVYHLPVFPPSHFLILTLCINTSIECEIIKFFLKEVSYVHQVLQLFDEKYSKNIIIIDFCGGKAEFSVAISQVDHSEIIPICWFSAQEKYLLLTK